MIELWKSKSSQARPQYQEGRSEDMKSTELMRNRARELASPPRDDFDRAVLATLEDFDHMRTILSDLVDAADSSTTLADERRRMPAIIQAAADAIQSDGGPAPPA
jgi:hypothetical protein